MANCLGVLPFLFVKQLSKNLIGISNAIACGVMLACSFDLIHEGEPYGPVLVAIGVLMGMLLVLTSQSFLQKYENIRFEAIEVAINMDGMYFESGHVSQGANARKILLVLGIMSVHAVGEGAGVGVSYSGKSGWTQGLLVTLAIGLHNIPEGLAVSTVLIARGVSPSRAVLWNLACALPQALVRQTLCRQETKERLSGCLACVLVCRDLYQLSAICIGLCSWMYDLGGLF